MHAAAGQPADGHFGRVGRQMLRGQVIPFLGAGVNLAGRSAALPAPARGPHELPSGRELADDLAKAGSYPGAGRDLLRTSLFLRIKLGEAVLYETLREIFAGHYEPNAVHRFLARLPALMRAERRNLPLMITTNYDDALERAFHERGEAFDLVYYEAKPESRGKLWHRPAQEQDFVLIEEPNRYDRLDLATTPIILKIHGTMDRADPGRDSYVITEDDYIGYIAHSQLADLALVTSHLRESHCLFMGYSLSDWNLRVLLRQIWGERRLSKVSWAVQWPRDDAEEGFEELLWRDRGEVELVYAPLVDYVQRLATVINPPDVPGE